MPVQIFFYIVFYIINIMKKHYSFIPRSHLRYKKGPNLNLVPPVHYLQLRSCLASDLVSRLGRPVPEVGMMSNYVMNMLRYHSSKSAKLSLVEVSKIQNYAHPMHDKTAALKNRQGFVHGAAHLVYRSNNRFQIMCYGHERLHSLKFQSVVAPNFLIA